MLFVDVRQSSAMAERMPPAEFAQAMNRFYAAATEVLIRTDAYVDKIVGDEVVGLYFPLFAGRSHARRAVEAAWKLLQESSYDEIGRPAFPLGIGVHTGTAFVGTVSGAEGTVTDIAALGEDVNITARLSSTAGAGEALISEAACLASGLDLDHLARRQVELRGLAGRLDVRVMRLGEQTFSAAWAQGASMTPGTIDAHVEGWVRVLDLRDRETEGHTQRVTELTVAVARAMGVADDDLVHIRRGALLHDIGKMGVPDNVLLKPGPLTDEEWQIMRNHPVYAYELLSRIKYLRPALDIPYCHHEKWDGTGYPRGLRSQEIPLAARIFAVVDVWDALQSDRPYRKAWPPERIRDHIRGQAGLHFDPNVVETALRVLGADATS